MARVVVDGYQLRLDGPPKPRSRFVWEPGEIARLREQTEVEHCEHCDRLIVGRKIRHQEIYQPFSDTPSVSYYCEPCSDRGYGQCEASFYCEGCEREVWDSNGHRVNMKMLGDAYYICVRCFQEDIFAHGHRDEAIDPPPWERFTIPCDWYDHAELRERGWTEGEEFSGDMLERSGGLEWRDYCRLLKLAGAMVLTDQGRTSIIGGPDYVTVWFKLPEGAEEVA